MTIAKIAESNKDDNYKKNLPGKTLNLYWGFENTNLPIVDLGLKGGSFCDAPKALLFSKWPLYDTDSLFPNLGQNAGNPNCPAKINQSHIDMGSPVGEKSFFFDNLSQNQEFKMQLEATNDVTYQRYLTKMISFDPNCSDEYQSIIEQDGPNSIEESKDKAQQSKFYVFIGAVIMMAFTHLFFVLAVLTKKSFTQNFICSKLKVLYYSTYIIYLFFIIPALLTVLKIVRLKVLLNRVDLNQCTVQSVSEFFVDNASKNNKT